MDIEYLLLLQRFRESISNALTPFMEQLSLFAQVPDPISERIRGLDLMNTTPSQALQILEELKEYL